MGQSEVPSWRECQPRIQNQKLFPGARKKEEAKKLDLFQLLLITEWWWTRSPSSFSLWQASQRRNTRKRMDKNYGWLGCLAAGAGSGVCSAELSFICLWASCVSGTLTPTAANTRHAVSKALTALALQKALEYPDGSWPRLLPLLNGSYRQKSHLPQIGWKCTHTCGNTKHARAWGKKGFGGG